MVWDETIVETISIFYIYVCVIKVEGYVAFLYEGSMYTRYEYIYYVYVEVYEILQVDLMKNLFFMHFQPMNVVKWD